MSAKKTSDVVSPRVLCVVAASMIWLSACGEASDGTAIASATAAIVGDGAIEPGEACDDGNTEPGDGCDSSGQVEQGFFCVDEPSSCCAQLHFEDGRKFYYCRDFTANQEQAVALCAGSGGRLARIDSPSVNAGVIPESGVWIDGDDRAVTDEWRYGDGTLMTYLNWAPGEPGRADEHCIHMIAGMETFHDLRCEFAIHFICEAQACGDGFLDEGEVCDDGVDNGSEGFCNSSCGNCGNGLLDDGEECDDGNEDDTDGCSNTCTRRRCGNAVVEGDEECDDGNVSNVDECLNTCEFAHCGDGFINGTEECDDGNAVDTDACTNDCLAAEEPVVRDNDFVGEEGGCSIGRQSDSTQAWVLFLLAVIAARIRH